METESITVLSPSLDGSLFPPKTCVIVDEGKLFYEIWPHVILAPNASETIATDAKWGQDKSQDIIGDVYEVIGTSYMAVVVVVCDSYYLTVHLLAF